MNFFFLKLHFDLEYGRRIPQLAYKYQTDFQTKLLDKIDFFNFKISLTFVFYVAFIEFENGIPQGHFIPHKQISLPQLLNNLEKITQKFVSSIFNNYNSNETDQYNILDFFNV